TGGFDGMADTHATQIMSPAEEPSNATATMPAAQGGTLSAQSNGYDADSLPEDGAADFDTTDQEKKRSPWFWPLIGVVILAALVGIGLWVSSLGSDEEPEPEPSETETVATVEITASDYVGRGLEEVTAELEELGFTVEAEERDDSEPYGTVIALDPTGEVEEGETITVTFSNAAELENQDVPAPEPEPQPTQEQPRPEPTTQEPEPTTQQPEPTTQQPEPEPTTQEPDPTTPEPS